MKSRMGLWEKLMATPGDLTAARVWGDALSEQGDPQGEFIQLSCALDELAIEDPRRRELQQRVRRLEARHHRTWIAQVWARKDSPVDTSTPGFFRGLPFRLRTSAQQLFASKQLERPVAALHLEWMRPDDLAAAGKLPQLKNLVDLEVRFAVKDAKSAGALLESSHLGALERLVLEDVAAEAIPPLVALECLRALRTLELPGCVLTDDLAVALAQSPHLQNVTRLHVNAEALSVAGLTALLDGKWKLSSLGFVGSPLGMQAVQTLVGHRSAENLRALDLEGCAIGVTGAGLLGGAKNLGRLHTLHVCLQKGKPKGGDGWDAFLSAFALEGLRALDLSLSPLREAGAKALAKTKALSKLESLNLAGCFLGDEGVIALSKAKGFPALVALNLSGNAMKEDGLPALATGPLLAPVEELQLAHNKFGSEGGKALGSSKRLGALRVLSLGHNWLGVLGMRSLLSNPSVKRLEEIRNGMNNYAAEVLTSYVKSKSLELLAIDAPDARKADLLALTRLPRAATLMELIVQSPDFDDEVAQAFVASPHLQGLGALDVASENLTLNGKAQLEQHYGRRVTVRLIAPRPVIAVG
jgi:uncharacterized protein (TIGR02996 family)